MRLDRMSGFWAFWWHYLIGLSFALHLPLAEKAKSTAKYSTDLHSSVGALSAVAYLYVWTTAFRGLTCTWNDILDAPFDRQVARTKFRPIARRAVGTHAALAFVLVQALLCTSLARPLPADAKIHACIMTGLLFIYPFLKRITDFPQVELAFGVSWAIFFVTAALDRDFGTDHLRWDAIHDMHSAWAFWQEVVPSLKAAILLYLAGALWHITVDTIYAHQDHDDDRKAGVRSLAVFLGRGGTKPTLLACSIFEVACALLAGWYAGFGPVYYAVACGGTALSLVTMLTKLQLEVPESCAFWFGPGSKLVGASMVAGLTFEHIAATVFI